MKVATASELKQEKNYPVEKYDIAKVDIDNLNVSDACVEQLSLEWSTAVSGL